jgi:hypothetical protein
VHQQGRSAALLSLGKPEEIEAYCKRLIDEVGEGGGFMLTSGCECPINVKRKPRAWWRPEELRGGKGKGQVVSGLKKGLKPKG